MIFTQTKRHHTQKYTYMTTNHDIIFPPRNDKKYVCTVARIMTSYFPPHDFRQQYRRKPTQFLTRGSPVVLDTSQIKPRTHPQHEARHPPAASAAMLSRGQKGDPNREPPFLSSYSAGIVSLDQGVAAVLQRRLHPTMSRGYWCCRCCCCYCCCYSYYCCYCHAAASCLCSSEPPVETLYRDQRGGWTPPSCRRFR